MRTPPRLVVGAGELRLALAAGADPASIVMHGNAKSDEDIAAALDAGIGHVVVDGEELRVQDVRRWVEEDPDPGPQQRLVVGALCVVDHELVSGLADEQLDVDAALGGRGHGVEQGLVRHEVRAGDGDPALGRVQQGRERAQVVLGGEPRTAGDHLGGHGPRYARGGLDLLRELVAQRHLAADRVEELDLGRGQLERRGCDVEILRPRLPDDRSERHLGLDEDVGDVRLYRVDVDAQTDGEVRLRIEVDHCGDVSTAFCSDS